MWTQEDCGKRKPFQTNFISVHDRQWGPVIKAEQWMWNLRKPVPPSAHGGGGRVDRPCGSLEPASPASLTSNSPTRALLLTTCHLRLLPPCVSSPGAVCFYMCFQPTSVVPWVKAAVKILWRKEHQVWSQKNHGCLALWVTGYEDLGRSLSLTETASLIQWGSKDHPCLLLRGSLIKDCPRAWFSKCCMYS